MPFPLFLALKYLRPRRDFASVIPIITTIGVSLGVAILMIVLAVMTGFGDAWNEKILGFKPHIAIYSREYGLIDEPDAVCDMALKIPGVKSACPAILSPVMVRGHESFEPVQITIIGIDPDRESILSQLRDRIVVGNYDASEDRVVIGSDLARRIGARVGSAILCYSPLNLNGSNELHLPEEMFVAGIYDTGMADYDSGFVICSLGMAREVSGADSGARLIQIQIADPQTAWVEARALQEILGPMYRVRTWQDEDRALFDALRTEKTMMFILLAFIAIVAAFCVTNTLIVITIQKTREIGLLKALGFSGAQIKSAFVLNGLIQCAAGELLGLALGWTVLKNLKNLVAFLAEIGIEVFPKSIYGLAEIPWRVMPSDVASVLATVFVFCVLASYLPAHRAARLDPVKAINGN